MTREEFFAWSPPVDGRYEFDGFQPVAMTGGSINHNLIMLNIQRALYPRLKGTGCRPLGPDAGVATIGNAVRYPHALITCAKPPGASYLVPGVCVVFEVVSQNSGRTERILKLREYQAVASILRYILVESTGIGLTVLSRAHGTDPWITSTLIAGESLSLPEAGIEVPVDEFYEDVDLPNSAPAA